MVIEAKHFCVIPSDAWELLTQRFSTIENAIDVASTQCEETGMRMVVVETKAIASRADRPIKVTKL